MKIFLSFTTALGALALIAGMSAKTTAPGGVTVSSFGRLPDGRETRLYTLRSADGLQADISDYGGHVVRLLVPDNAGRVADVALGFNNVGTYAKSAAYFGALIGRVTNRIAGARFELDGRIRVLAANDNPGGVPCHLHGGAVGFSRVLWTAEPTTRDGQPALRLRYTSPDGEEGYPGTLKVEALYSLTADRGLRVDFSATTDQATPFNPTCHIFFNLAGEGRGTILDHEVTIRARRYTPMTAGLIPTGEIAPVAGTPLDFTTPHTIGSRIADPFEQLRRGDGYNHNYVLDSADGSLALAATVVEPASGRVLEVLTTEPGLQFFTANSFDGHLVGKTGRPYPRFAGFCLESQHFVDSVNRPEFPSTILRPGATFRSTTVFRFPVR